MLLNIESGVNLKNQLEQPSAADSSDMAQRYSGLKILSCGYLDNRKYAGNKVWLKLPMLLVTNSMYSPESTYVFPTVCETTAALNWSAGFADI